MARASVKKEDRRDSEHDAICAWLVKVIGNEQVPRELFGELTCYHYPFPDVECELRDQRGNVIGFADLIAEYATGAITAPDGYAKALLIEVKSSREPFSAGDVIRQIQTYRRSAKKFDRSVLVTTVKLSNSAKELLTHEGIFYWELEWTLAPVPSHTS